MTNTWATLFCSVNENINDVKKLTFVYLPAIVFCILSKLMMWYLRSTFMQVTWIGKAKCYEGWNKFYYLLI